MVRSAVRYVGWDAILPVLIALMPFIVRLLFPHGHMLDVAVAIVAPVLGAFLRGAIGVHQLDEITNGRPKLGRQLQLTIAIVLLFLVEVFVSTLQYARNEPLTAWFFPAGFFCLYLMLIQNALRPDDDQSYDMIEAP